MLCRLTIENFGSVLDRQTLDLAIPPRVPVDTDRQFTGPHGIRIPKVAAILGPNASGKTTMLRACAAVADLLGRSAWKERKEWSLLISPFNSAEGEARPTVLEIEFSGTWLRPEGNLYRYTLRTTSGKRMIDAEVLEVQVSRKTWKPLIKREREAVEFFNAFEDVSKNFPHTAATRLNASALSLAAQFSPEGHPIQKMSFHFEMMSACSNVLSFARWDREYEEVITDYAQFDYLLKDINDVIHTIDVGIDSIRTHFDEDTNKHSLLLQHKGHGRPLPLSFESEGTKNFVRIFPQLRHAILTGVTCALDEVDSDLHPTLLAEIVGWFTSERTNSHNAQLLMSINNPSILNELEREEIFITSKDENGQSRLRAVKDIDGVRRDANFHREYLAGLYGGIPQIG